jgi:hypothetical protein
VGLTPPGRSRVVVARRTTAFTSAIPTVVQSDAFPEPYMAEEQPQSAGPRDPRLLNTVPGQASSCLHDLASFVADTVTGNLEFTDPNRFLTI